MDEELETIIGKTRSGNLEGLVWKEVIVDEHPVTCFNIELRNRRGESFLLAIWQVSDLTSVLLQALDCIREYADDEIQGDLARLLTALRTAEKSRTH